MSERRVIEGPKAAYENFHFAAASWSGDLLHLSGAIGAEGSSVPEDFEQEARNAWKSVGKVLEEAGLGYENIVEYTTFHVGLSSTLPVFMKVRDEFIGEPWPAWTAIGITELAIPGARLELRVTAARNP